MAQLDPLSSFSALPYEVFFWLMVAWLAAMGGAVGSFLNVVVYRLPAGISLVWPGSHCPTCNKPIRWHDNVPVFGWLILRGRCRDCGAEISARYPVIEATTAGLFALLGIVECLGEGANLPVPVEGLEALCTIYGYHLLLFCTLLAAVLIQYDGHRVPWRLGVPALLVGLAAPLYWPHLHPVAAWVGWSGGWVGGLVDGLAGLAAGLAAGAIVSRLVGAEQRAGTILSAGCVGLFLGWQALVGVTAAATAIHLLSMAVAQKAPAARRVPLSAWLALAALGWVLRWAWLVGS